ncbi:PilZ domain-containing protein [Chitinimonas sp.]|uniref:PilZ domain-containing protein n=1 Tax=Chitinimonas sp. TaxID=1934313 RepID=UPI0035B1F808
MIEISARLPVQWEGDTVGNMAEGSLLLRVLALLESQAVQDDDDSPEALRWQAMEARIDLCLQLLAQLLARNAPPPAAVPLRLASSQLAWESAQALAQGMAGAVAIWLSPLLPRPLLLPARISACDAHGDAFWITAQFDVLDSQLQDLLDKTIFRKHRREVFERRHQGSGHESA